MENKKKKKKKKGFRLKQFVIPLHGVVGKSISIFKIMKDYLGKLNSLNSLNSLAYLGFFLSRINLKFKIILMKLVLFFSLKYCHSKP